VQRGGGLGAVNAFAVADEQVLRLEGREPAGRRQPQQQVHAHTLAARPAASA
jgi:hypothetical protein